MNNRMVCKVCGKERPMSQYKSLMRQHYEDPICAYCRQKFPPSAKGKVMHIGSEKPEMRDCLGACGKQFLTTKSIRFCKRCKPKGVHDDYKIELGGS